MPQHPRDRLMGALRMLFIFITFWRNIKKNKPSILFLLFDALNRLVYRDLSKKVYLQRGKIRIVMVKYIS